ncbi:hypothetical protein PF002_g14679 [Phytophthora fragariae]|uniref:Uncharacterized protein n=1 Tax=Phytophthora fragariae TaxID=53985 RepID=A0A6A3YVZ6_9STRA|nr:hypothetical protein PF002_g14679 [Phytophthora fragariae]
MKQIHLNRWKIRPFEVSTHEGFEPKMETPQSLFEAARRGDIHNACAILEAGANVDAKGEDGNTALMEAAAWGRTEIVEYLVGACAGDVNSTNREGVTALMKAAAGGHTDVVRYLAKECGADVNAATVFGDSAATLAAQYGHADLTQYLVVECNAIVNTTSRTTLRVAVDRHDDVARILTQDQKSAPHENTWSSTLIQAAVDGSIDGLRCIVSNFTANVNVTDRDGDTALLKAAGLGHLAVVRYLVAECGADVNTANHTGMTALLKTVELALMLLIEMETQHC